MAKKKATINRKSGINRALTEGQEQFLQNLMSGMTQPEAYIAAYPSAAKWQHASVVAEATKMLRKPHVAARYEKLRAEYKQHLTKKSFYNRDNLLGDFMYLKNKAEESIDAVGVRQANTNAYLGALKNIGEILELYPDAKLSINATMSGDFEINILNDIEDEDDNPEEQE